MKKSILFLLLASVALSSWADCLKWQVTQDMLTSDSYLSSHLDPNQKYLTQIKYGAADANPATYQVCDPNGDYSQGVVGNGYAYVDLDTIGSDPSAYSYYIEIFQYDAGNEKALARSETMAYSALDAYYIGAIMDMPNMQAWTGGSYTVPEPTSALMMMIGVAFLGLKRRKV